MIWSESCDTILTGCIDGKVRVWDSRTGTCQKVFSGHEDAILDLALSKYVAFPYECPRFLICALNDYNTYILIPMWHFRGQRFILSSSDDHTVRAFEY